jgi:endo-1,4-beta-xylanase
MTYYQFLPMVVVISLLIGTCVQAGNIPDANYQKLITSNYQMIIPENEGKRWFIEQYGFEPMDSIVSFADQHNLRVHYHALLWWWDIPNDPCTWIKTVMGRYPTIKSWDVVNEAWNEAGPTSNLDVAAAFRCAREVRDDTTLWYNGIFSSQLERDNALALLRDGLADGIGIQAHLTLDSDLESLAIFASQIEEFGNSWRLSELDIRIPVPLSNNDLEKQSLLFQRIIEMCRKSDHCVSISIWGASDLYSWIPYQYGSGWGNATLIENTSDRKEAWEFLTRSFVHEN